MAEAAFANDDLLNRKEEERVATSISDRLSKELVIALVGPVGSGVTTAGNYIKEVLQQQFGYDVPQAFKVSDVIRTELPRVGLALPDSTVLNEYIDSMQTAGNKLREKFGPNYLVEKVIEKIVKYRKDRGGYGGPEGQVHLPGRRAYIVDSLKNMEELELLRQIYGDTLCLFGIFAPDDVRKDRLVNNGADEEDVRKILDRDQGEILTFGQQTRDIFVEADFFICNDHKPDELRQHIARFLEIIFDSGIHTPNNAETAMYEAEAAAANSACMSRQVGAAIISKSGELISIGRNDVPKPGGGLYTEDDQSVWSEQAKGVVDRDHRCFRWQKRICHNEVRRNNILDTIAIKLVQANITKKEAKLSEVRKALSGTDVDALTEFSRSIHAEMEAILAVAREGRHSLGSATLFTTTYPCHNCARHIVAAGIANVIYIRPYRKSLALALHGDAITEDVNDAQGRVVFRQYEGVSPRNYLKLFRPKGPRKKEGKLFRVEARNALPVLRIPLDGPVDYEAKVIADLAAKEQADSGKAVQGITGHGEKP
jgi:deoxycytidylate deaminase